MVEPRLSRNSIFLPLLSPANGQDLVEYAHLANYVVNLGAPGFKIIPGDAMIWSSIVAFPLR